MRCDRVNNLAGGVHSCKPFRLWIRWLRADLQLFPLSGWRVLHGDIIPADIDIGDVFTRLLLNVLQLTSEPILPSVFLYDVYNLINPRIAKSARCFFQPVPAEANALHSS